MEKDKKIRKIKEKIEASGHHNIRSTHRTTLEITKEDHLTPGGDCIVAVSADKGFPELSEEFKDHLKDKGVKIRIRIECSGISEEITGRGHLDLTFKNPEEMVVRKSSFVCDRTLAIRADKAALDLDRELIENLKLGKRVRIEMEIIENLNEE